MTETKILCLDCKNCKQSVKYNTSGIFIDLFCVKTSVYIDLSKNIKCNLFEPYLKDEKCKI